MATTFQAKSPKDSPQIKRLRNAFGACWWPDYADSTVAGLCRLRTGRITAITGWPVYADTSAHSPAPRWPDYADTEVAGLCRSLTSKTWLSEDTGPITSVAQLLGQAARFQLKPLEATAVLAEVVKAVKQWRDVALTADVGLPQAELEDFAPAFEHAGLDEALALLA